MVEKHARLSPPLQFQPRSCHRMPPGSGTGGQYRDLSPHRSKRHGDGPHAMVEKGHTQRPNPSSSRPDFFCPARGLFGAYLHVLGDFYHCVRGNWKLRPGHVKARLHRLPLIPSPRVGIVNTQGIFLARCAGAEYQGEPVRAVQIRRSRPRPLLPRLLFSLYFSFTTRCTFQAAK